RPGRSADAGEHRPTGGSRRTHASGHPAPRRDSVGPATAAQGRGGKISCAARAILFSCRRSAIAPTTPARPGIALPNRRTERSPKRRRMRPPRAPAIWDSTVPGRRLATWRLAAPATGPSPTLPSTSPDSSPIRAASAGAHLRLLEVIAAHRGERTDQAGGPHVALEDVGGAQDGPGDDAAQPGQGAGQGHPAPVPSHQPADGDSGPATSPAALGPAGSLPRGGVGEPAVQPDVPEGLHQAQQCSAAFGLVGSRAGLPQRLAGGALDLVVSSQQCENSHIAIMPCPRARSASIYRSARRRQREAAPGDTATDLTSGGRGAS